MMDTNGANVSSDTDITDCDGEKVVTMMDVLREQQDFEDDANAVLGASDEKNCTFQKGYVKRQAIYACLTCCPEAKFDETKRAGVCLACSLNCHENHELVELYTKRNFRCDCGNPKFNSTCQFTAEKTDLNEENNYNQNFSGLYCICQRPYPDPEAVEEDEMIQCIMCEDWLHSAHLETVVPPIEQYAEMICKACLKKNEFLHDYIDYAVNTDNLDVDILSENPELSIVNVTSITNDADLLNDSTKANIDEQSKSDVQMETSDTVKTITNSQEQEEKQNLNTENSDDQNNANSKDEAINETNTDNIHSTSDEQIKDVPDTISSDTEPINHDSVTSSKPNEENILLKDDKLNENIDTEAKANENIEQKDITAEVTSAESDETNYDKTLDEKEPAVDDNADNIGKRESQDETCNYTDNRETINEPISENIVTLDDPTSSSMLNGDHDSNNENKRKLEDLEADAHVGPKKIKLDEDSDKKDCLRPMKGKKTFKGASFWPSNFRQKLCTCNECISMYKDLSVLYLIDLEDTVSAYETLGQEKTNGIAATQYEKGLEALSSLDRVQQINALTEYNNMRDKLLDFLKSFKDKKEIVKEDDIKAFFAGMKAKREPDGVYFCR